MKRTEKICCILAAFCLISGILLQSVFTAVRFTGVLLLCAAAALAAFALLTRWKEKHRWALWLRRVFLALLAAGFVFFAVLEIRVVSCARTDDAPAAALIVFGAGVDGRAPSLTLRSRLEAALEYIRIQDQRRPDMPVVVTGAQGRGEEISEARCMADWLIARGVEPERIWLEEQATNTEENVRYSIHLLAERGVDTTADIAFCTSDYHMCRAIYLRGYPYVVPVSAALPAKYWPLTLNYYIREAFAMAKAIVFR